MTGTIDEMETFLADRPQRALRQRNASINYNLTPTRTRKKRNFDLNPSDGKENNPFCTPKVDDLQQNLKETTSPWSNVPYIKNIVAVISFVLSILLIAYYFLKEGFLYLYKKFTEFLQDLSIKERLEPLTSAFSGLSPTSLKDLCSNMTYSLFITNLLKKIVSWNENLKTLLSKPKNMFKLKTFIMLISLLTLGIALFYYEQKGANRLKVIVNDYKNLKPPKEEITIDKDGCTNAGCYVQKSLLVELHLLLDNYEKSKKIYEKRLSDQLKILNEHSNKLEGLDNTISEKLKILNDFESKMSSLQLQMDMNQDFNLRELKDSIADVENRLNSNYLVKIEKIEAIIDQMKPKDHFKMYGPDYSLYSAGANVDYLKTSKSYYEISQKDELESFSPLNVLTNSLELGSCWGMKGNNGQIEIVLSRKISPKLFVIKHPSYERLYKDSFKSAPKTINIYIKKTQNSKEIFVGTIEFDPHKGQDGILVLDKPFDKIERVVWKVSNNWGNKDWTSIYRLEVHGQE